MISTAAISEAEVRAVQEGILHDSREDGRTLLQRRPIHIQVGPRRGTTAAMAEQQQQHVQQQQTEPQATQPISGASAAMAAEEQESYDGSSVTVTLAETTVLAAASPSVIEVPHSTPDSLPGEKEEEGEEKEEGEGSEGKTEKRAREDKGEGLLYISMDAAPNVVDFYAHAMGGRQGSYRRAYLAALAATVRQMFGAQSVAVQDTAGVAEARVVAEEEEEDDEDEGGDVGDNNDNNNNDDEGEGENGKRGTKTQVHATGAEHTSTPFHTVAAASGFPAAALYVGQGFGFRIDVDVYILQARGGNVVTAVACAVHAALKAIRLPSVTLHKSAAGISVEVDQSQPYDRAVDWSRLPLLTLCLLSPTRHYVIDPTVREELALPRQLQVAANGNGEVVFSDYQQLPSRRGDALLVTQADMEHEESPRKEEEENETAEAGSGGRGERKRPRTEDGTAEGAKKQQARDGKAGGAVVTELQVNDWLAVLGDAVHVCQAMIADCDALFAASSPRQVA